MAPGQTHSPLTAQATPDDTATIAMSSQSSTASLVLPIEFGTEVVPVPPPSGTVALRGGNCPGRACAVSLDRVELHIAPFIAQHTGLGETVITNSSPIIGTKNASGALLFPQAAVNAGIGSSIAGMRTSGELVPDADMTGAYDPVTGVLQLSATFSEGEGLTLQQASFTLVGQATARPPVVIAGADQSVSCGATGPATVTVDGSQSFDPDGDSFTLTWSDNGTVVANTAAAALQLGVGVHDLMLIGRDSTGLNSVDQLRVTVADTTAPRFTFVPPAVVRESPGPVSIGQATAQDDCGGTVTVRNNAPASFPAGHTVVTWTATDAARNSATATEDVYILPSSVASCPPGSHIILGTSNNDVLTGTDGPDCIIGFGGQDRIDGRGGDDVLLGGDGDDVIVGGGGNDVIFGGSGQDRLGGDAGRDVLAGGDGDDVLSGGDGDDTLLGGQGQDHLNGDAGNDTLAGSEGDDTLQGGAGVDRCIADGGHDTLLTCEL